MAARVVHCRREPYDVYGGRPGPWGNPFVVGRDGTREEVIARHRAWFLAQPAMVAAARVIFRDAAIGCWCAPKPCHCDVYAEVANEGAQQRRPD